MFITLLLLLLSACSNSEDNQEGSPSNSSAESGMNKVDIQNFSLEPFSSGETYFVVADMNWQGDTAAQLNSIGLIEEDGTPISSEKGITANFYIGDEHKKSGVYRRDEIGEYTKVNGAELEDRQTLIMEYTLSHVPKNSLNRIKLSYEVDGKSFSESYTWSTLKELETN
ncbi:hypothetical protein [Thalassobacillus sp. CUG 92003]|uniref:hypothetical protein n=1 Tax=Thalassobacillus sp. CUG 92003 TaxID=2736641 RepID=UPI0015E6D0A3|nr:hypothetical protein [Thalassobacillus sp. CUG 92003]